MSQLLAKIKTWHSQGRRFNLEKWERTRAQGQARYIIQNTMLVGLFMMLVYDLFAGRFGIEIALRAHFIGLITGWNWWRIGEKNYQKALLEARPKTTAAPTNVLGLRDS